MEDIDTRAPRHTPAHCRAGARARAAHRAYLGHIGLLTGRAAESPLCRDIRGWAFKNHVALVFSVDIVTFHAAKQKETILFSMQLFILENVRWPKEEAVCLF